MNDSVAKSASLKAVELNKDIRMFEELIEECRDSLQHMQEEVQNIKDRIDLFQRGIEKCKKK